MLLVDALPSLHMKTVTVVSEPSSSWLCCEKEVPAMAVVSSEGNVHSGSSFAVALSLASRWYPPSRQGVVMGIVTAGTSGTVVANLFAPQLASICGWHVVLALTLIPLTVILLAFFLMAKESPTKPKSIPTA